MDPTNVLRAISNAWAHVHVTIIFYILFKPRFSKKMSLWVMLTVMGILAGVNVAIGACFGRDMAAILVIPFVLVPSMIYFYAVSECRDGRFFFTFMMTRLVSIDIVIFSAILDAVFFGNLGIFNLIFRLSAYPIIEIILYKKLSNIYISLQNENKIRWNWYAIVTSLSYAAMTFFMLYPTFILNEPSHFPYIITLGIVTVVVHIAMFRLIKTTKLKHDIEKSRELLRLEREHMEDMIRNAKKLEERIRIERHDLKHRMALISAMIARKEYEGAKEFIDGTVAHYDDLKIARYCTNAVLNSVFDEFFKKAEAKGIRLVHTLAIPDRLPIEDRDLAIIIANALDNAIHACEELPEEERYIECRYLNEPMHMLQISNPYVGRVNLDEDGRPVSKISGHGIGTRSILHFCEMYNAHLDYKITDGIFNIRIVFGA